MVIEYLAAQIIISSIAQHSQLNIANTEALNNSARIIYESNQLKDPIRADLKDKNLTIKIRTIHKIGNERNFTYQNDLVSLLGHPNYKVRSASCIALGKMGSSDIALDLIKMLSDKNHIVRSSAALSLGKLNSSVAIDSLIERLKDSEENENVKLASIYALCVTQAEKSIDPIINLLSDSSPKLRANAAWALGILKVKKALPLLQSLINDKDLEVKKSAIKAIFQIKYEIISDTSSVIYTGGNGTSLKDAITITGLKNSFTCLRSQKEYLNKYYGNEQGWEQVKQTIIKHKNKHYNLITVKENESGEYRKFYFDITEFYQNLK